MIWVGRKIAFYFREEKFYICSFSFKKNYWILSLSFCTICTKCSKKINFTYLTTLLYELECVLSFDVKHVSCLDFFCLGWMACVCVLFLNFYFIILIFTDGASPGLLPGHWWFGWKRMPTDLQNPWSAGAHLSTRIISLALYKWGMSWSKRNFSWRNTNICCSLFSCVYILKYIYLFIKDYAFFIIMYFSNQLLGIFNSCETTQLCEF